MHDNARIAARLGHPLAGLPAAARVARAPRRTCRAPACRPSTRTTTSAAGSATGCATTAAGWSPDVGALLALMDATGVEAIVNLDGRWGEELEANLDRYDRAHPGRFFTFCHVDWAHAGRRRGRPGRVARASRDAGARGLKVWKDLGLGVDRRRAARSCCPTTRACADVWAAAGELGLPVLIHTADPVAFWDPVDAAQRALRGARRAPRVVVRRRRASRAGSGCSTRSRRVVAAHRRTTFIGAHVCSCAEDLARGRPHARPRYPNLTSTSSARIGELGRQPRAARRLICRHPDRVLFGTDVFPPTRAAYELHWRFFETDDEHFAVRHRAETPAAAGPLVRQRARPAAGRARGVLPRECSALLEIDRLERLPCRNEHHLGGDRQPAGGLAARGGAGERGRRPPPRARRCASAPSAAARRCTWRRRGRRCASAPVTGAPTRSPPPSCRAGAATTSLVAISRSGTTSEVLHALAAPRRRGPLAGDHRGRRLAGRRRRRRAIVLDFADERSVVQTRFATTALTLLRDAERTGAARTRARSTRRRRRRALERPLPVDARRRSSSGRSSGAAGPSASRTRRR